MNPRKHEPLDEGLKLQMEQTDQLRASLTAERERCAALEKERDEAAERAHELWLDALGESGLVTTYSTGETEQETIGAIMARLADDRDTLRERCAQLQRERDALQDAYDCSTKTELLQRERLAALQQRCDRLAASMSEMLEWFGNPRPIEWTSSEAYRESLAVVKRAGAALSPNPDTAAAQGGAKP